MSKTMAAVKTIRPSIIATQVPSVKPVYLWMIWAARSVPPVDAFPRKTMPRPSPTDIPPNRAPSRGSLVHGSRSFEKKTTNGRKIVPTKVLIPNCFPRTRTPAMNNGMLKDHWTNAGSQPIVDFRIVLIPLTPPEAMLLGSKKTLKPMAMIAEPSSMYTYSDMISIFRLGLFVRFLFIFGYPLLFRLRLDSAVTLLTESEYSMG
jgi:hypothetical protein